MAGDDYTSVGGGRALRLKGSKIQKPKKKKNKDSSSSNTKSLERALGEATGDDDEKHRSRRKGTEEKTDEEDKDQQDEDGEKLKTDAERQFEERNKKKMMKMFESSTARPELLKTHKERVEGLNTYLSKLSEHHDMPKIGPG